MLTAARIRPSNTAPSGPPSTSGRRLPVAVAHMVATAAAPEAPQPPLPPFVFRGLIRYGRTEEDINAICREIQGHKPDCIGFDVSCLGRGPIVCRCVHCSVASPDMHTLPTLPYTPTVQPTTVHTQTVEGCCLSSLGNIWTHRLQVEWWCNFAPGVPPRPVSLVQVCWYAGPPVLGPPGQGQGGLLVNVGPGPPVRIPGPITDQSNYRVALLHVHHSGPTWPEALQELLRAPAVLKSGCGIHGDAYKVEAQLGAQMEGLVELSTVAARKLPKVRSKSGGRAAARDLLG